MILERVCDLEVSIKSGRLTIGQLLLRERKRQGISAQALMRGIGTDQRLYDMESGRHADKQLVDIYVGHQANRPDHQGMFTRIYFDVEQGGVLSSEYVLYVTNWCGYLKNLSSYIPSVYCSYSDTADQFKNMVSGMGGRIYCYRIGTYTGNSGVDPAPNPANCSVAYASTWQLEQEVSKTFGDYTLVVDMNSSIYQDPSR